MTKPKNKKTTRRLLASKTAKASASIDQRHHMISEAAYYRSEKRSIEGSNPSQDWYEAEQEIEARYRWQ
ncbi:MAG: hypothetical protein C9356_10235 [Oleiphilus sp.]|nr:MAG: hypothetical protein C9356_10235 [Oleiphilus sp.]